MLKVQRNSKGFTLIELLIVIAIIGILAAIAIPAYTSYTRKAKVQEVIHSMGAVKTAVMAYYTEAGAGPDDAVDFATIQSELGIGVPVKYLTSMVVTSPDTGAIGSVITATFNTVIGGDVTGTAILQSTRDYKTWEWTGTLPASYMPKN